MDVFNLNLIKPKVIEKLLNVYDPEIPVNIFDLGLIYSIDFEKRGSYLFCFIKMTLTSPSCPVADSLLSQVKYVSLSVDEIDEVDVELVFEPQWDITKISEQAREILILEGVHIPEY